MKSTTTHSITARPGLPAATSMSRRPAIGAQRGREQVLLARVAGEIVALPVGAEQRRMSFDEPIVARYAGAVEAGAGHGFIKPTVRGSESWLVYGQFGGNYAIDAAKKYRAGMTVRWFRDPIGVPVQQWIAVSAEFSYSFGR